MHESSSLFVFILVKPVIVRSHVSGDDESDATQPAPLGDGTPCD